MALAMIERALDDQLPRGVVLADSGYGNSSAFREELRYLGLDYAVGIEGSTRVWLLDSRNRRKGKPVSVGKLASKLRFRRARIVR